MDDATLLAECELFHAFDADDVARIVSEASVLHLRRGDPVFNKGDLADRMYVIRGGRIAVSRRSPDGKESIISVLEAGDAFGELSLFDGDHRAVGARALEPSQLLVVPFAPVTQVLRERPSLLWPMVTLLCRRLRVTDARMADALFLDIAGRTARRLLELAGGREEFVLPITQEELAGMVGASRERVNKALARFIRVGWLAVDGRRYRILKPAELGRRAR